MIREQIDGFIDGLIEKTKDNKIEWMPLSAFHRMRELDDEFDSGFGSIDFMVNSIREKSSYFLKCNDGYVFLFEIFHGDPEVTSPIFDTLALMVKINSTIPIDNLSNYMQDEEHQEKLSTLKLLIEHYLEDKFSMPDALYEFMAQVLCDENDIMNEDSDETTDGLI